MKSYDYIVVGAGSAGCVLSRRLTEDNTTVLLLEAGRRDTHPWLRMPIAFMRMSQDPNYIWQFETEPEPGLGGRRIPLRRGRTLGGTSSINGMIFSRGHRLDYDGWCQRGLVGWSYADVLPYFKRLETSWRGESADHGGEGPIGVKQVDHPQMLYEPLAKAAEAVGLPARDDYNSGETEGVSRIELAVANGERQSTARRYLHPALSRSTLTVQTEATTTRVLLESGRAVGVEYFSKGEKHRAYADREVILSGGPYNSPQLLMLSGIGPADHLTSVGITPSHDLPGVGQNLSEHPNMLTTFRANTRDTFLNQLRLDRAGVSGARWHLLRSGAFTNNGAAAVIFARTLPRLERPDVQLVCMPITNYANLWFPGLLPPVDHSFTVRVGTLYPRSRGWVKLRSDNPTDQPRIQFNLFTEQADVADMIRAIRLAREIYRTEPQRSLVSGESFPGEQVVSDADLEQVIRAHGHVRQHALGTCAMGITEEAVVDPMLRVRGIEQLRVVDASVMPEEPGGNTNIPTIMIAEKASDMIRGRLPASVE